MGPKTVREKKSSLVQLSSNLSKKSVIFLSIFALKLFFTRFSLFKHEIRCNSETVLTTNPEIKGKLSS